MNYSRIFALALVSFSFSATLFAQTDRDRDQWYDGRQNVITTAVPFLGITPDSRSGGMAEVGVATSPDANSIHWNPAKLSFVDRDFSFSISHTPWLKALVPDINLSYLSGFYRIDNQQTIGASLRYFSLGDIMFTDNVGSELGNYRPYEFAVDGAYSRKLSDMFAVGLALRYIYSDLSGNIPMTGGVDSRPGTSVAGDISMYFQNDISFRERDSRLSIGMNISNIGSKVTYTDESLRFFIPSNLKLGSSLLVNVDDYNQVTFSLDFNKLLVPTNPILVFDEELNDWVISEGYDPDVPVIQGMIQSLYDAPGGFSEEIREINPSVGMEYWYDQQFAIRGGYFYEHPTKGNRQYLTLGAGVRYNVFGLDFAYLIPTNTGRTTVKSPLENTLRFSLLFNFGEADVQRAHAPRTPTR